MRCYADRVSHENLSEAVYAGLGPHAEKLVGRCKFDSDQAATVGIREGLTTYGEGLIGSTTPVTKASGNGNLVGVLDVVALPPYSGTGDYRQYGPDCYDDISYTRSACPYARRPSVIGQAVLSIASFDLGVAEPIQTMNAVHLRKMTVRGQRLEYVATVGQEEGDFERTMAQEDIAAPSATLTIGDFGAIRGNTHPGLFPVEALYNTSSHLQVVGVLAAYQATEQVVDMFAALDAQLPPEVTG